MCRFFGGESNLRACVCDSCSPSARTRPSSVFQSCEDVSMGSKLMVLRPGKSCLLLGWQTSEIWIGPFSVGASMHRHVHRYRLLCQPTCFSNFHVCTEKIALTHICFVMFPQQDVILPPLG